MKTTTHIITILLLAISASVSVAGEMKLTQKQYGKKWPLNVDSGVVKCLPLGIGAIIFETQGKTYAVNGIAKGFSKKYGFLDIDKILMDDPEFYSFAKEAAKAEGISVEKAIKIMGGPTKINISPILDSGLKLCQ